MPPVKLPASFQALVVRNHLTDGPADIRAQIESLPLEQLPPGEVVIRVHYSSLNYKDALAARGHPGIAKSLPHIPGVDAAGVVVESQDPVFLPGQEVLVTGFELGAGRWGGFSQFIRVPAAWVLPLPTDMTMRQSMIFGTAGFTAGLCVLALQDHDIWPHSGPVIVTGASGGVGSHAVAILAHLGYDVTAVTGKNPDYVRNLGARRALSREEILDKSDRPLLKGHWAGGVDTVGGEALTSIVRGTRQHGCVTACGLVGGAELRMTVYPFILRGVSLVGIDASQTIENKREKVWEKLAGDWRVKDLEQLVAAEVTLVELPAWIEKILAGEVQGRVVVRVGE
ncbi:MAG: YhdH/YhfP family quinone oxidoreductase [Pirellulales bacterium]|nr:YhdH/YhfP family quinone oxidoreductase [Pirellulales bacterium]